MSIGYNSIASGQKKTGEGYVCEIEFERFRFNYLNYSLMGALLSKF